MKRGYPSFLRDALPYLVIAFFLAILLLPFYWMVITSIKPDAEIYTLSDPLIVKNPTVGHYGSLLGRTDFLVWFRNTAFVGFTTSFLAIIIGTLAAYGLTRLEIKGRAIIITLVIISYLVPPGILFLPLFKILEGLGLIDTMGALLVSYPTFTVPFCTWLLIGFFKGVPKQLEEAALIDGCNRLQVLINLVVPLAIPGIIAAGVFTLALMGEEYLYALVFVKTSGLRTVPVGISLLQFGDIFFWGQIMAAGTLTAVPYTIFFMFLQKYLIKGLTAGAVKG